MKELSEFEEKPTLRHLVSVISKIGRKKGYLDVTDCCEAIAAADVLSEVAGVPVRPALLSKEVLNSLRVTLLKTPVA